MSRKKSSVGGLLLFLCLFFLWLISRYSTAVLLIGLIVFIIWLIKRATATKNSKSVPAATIKEASFPENVDLKKSFKITVSVGPNYPGFAAKSANGDDYWVPRKIRQYSWARNRR
ncbi:MAG: hypothetical protein ACYDH0_11020, partial [Candidatus Aminicenantales bacterium]